MDDPKKKKKEWSDVSHPMWDQIGRNRHPKSKMFPFFFLIEDLPTKHLSFWSSKFWFILG